MEFLGICILILLLAGGPRPRNLKIVFLHLMCSRHCSYKRQDKGKIINLRVATKSRAFKMENAVSNGHLFWYEINIVA